MTQSRLKVLISAYHCQPGKGSEHGKGWACATALARDHEVWVLTRRVNAEAIEGEMARNPVEHLHFIYVDVGQRRHELPKDEVTQFYYYLWQILAYVAARAAHREVGFDVAQHIAFSKYWIPSFLPLLPLPFVWGPVGGGESAPLAFFRRFSARGKVYEGLRTAARVVAECDPFLRWMTRRAAVTFATSPESAERLKVLGAHDVRLYPAIGLPREAARRLSDLPAPADAPLRFICIGRLLHWKGFDLAVEAFAKAGIAGAELWIVGGGAEYDNLARLGARLGLGGRLKLFGRLPLTETLARLSESHVLLHPSLHESGGLTCVEAMAAGRPVVCLRHGGPAVQVTAQEGILLDPISPEQVIADLAAAMRRLSGDAELRRRLGEAGRRRVAEHYVWDRKAAFYGKLYRQLLAAAPLPPASRASQAELEEVGRQEVGGRRAKAVGQD